MVPGSTDHVLKTFVILGEIREKKNHSSLFAADPTTSGLCLYV